MAIVVAAATPFAEAGTWPPRRRRKREERILPYFKTTTFYLYSIVYFSVATRSINMHRGKVEHRWASTDHSCVVVWDWGARGR